MAPATRCLAAAPPIVPPLAGATAGQWLYQMLPNGMTFDVLLPYGYSKNYSYPVILYLHGLNAEAPFGTPPYNSFPAFMNSTSVNGVNYRANYPAIIVAPQCAGAEFGSNDWGGTAVTLQNKKLANPDMPCGDGAIQALKIVIRNTSADITKVYIVGYSLGGIGTYYLYATHRQLFAAGMPVAGAIFGSVSVDDFERYLVRKPLWAFHGFNDQTVSKAWDEAMYTRSQMRHAPMKYIEFIVSGDVTTFPSELEPVNGDGHANADTSAFEDTATMDWLFAQSH